MNKVAIVVDPLSSGRLIAKELKKRNIDCISIFSAKIPSFLESSYDSENFIGEFYFNGNFSDLIGSLKDYDISYVFCGLETGVILADQLADHFKLPGNGVELSVARQDKYITQETMRSKGVPATLQIKTSSKDEMLKWIDANNVWPAIIKPNNSAGSDNIHLCHTPEEAVNAFNAIVGKKNVLELDNSVVLVQQFLEGVEYVVDTVSCQGIHYVTNISRYKKVTSNGSSFVYRHVDFLPPSESQFSEIIDYALKVNDAVGLSYGPAHLEIIMTEEGPRLVELNARMHGGTVPEILRSCCDYSQLDLTIDAYTDPEAFKEKTKNQQKYNKSLIAHFLISGAKGKVDSVPGLTKIESLPSYLNSYLVEEGADLDITTNLTNAAGLIWLLHDDPSVIEQDQESLIQLEQNEEVYKLTSA